MKNSCCVTLLALRKSVGFPVISNLIGQPSELRRVSQVLHLVTEIEAIVVRVNGRDATLGLLLVCGRPVAEGATRQPRPRLRVAELRHLHERG